MGGLTSPSTEISDKATVSKTLRYQCVDKQIDDANLHTHRHWIYNKVAGEPVGKEWSSIKELAEYLHGKKKMNMTFTSHYTQNLLPGRLQI